MRNANAEMDSKKQRTCVYGTCNAKTAQGKDCKVCVSKKRRIAVGPQCVHHTIESLNHASSQRLTPHELQHPLELVHQIEQQIVEHLPSAVKTKTKPKKRKHALIQPIVIEQLQQELSQKRQKTQSLASTPIPLIVKVPKNAVEDDAMLMVAMVQKKHEAKENKIERFDDYLQHVASLLKEIPVSTLAAKFLMDKIKNKPVHSLFGMAVEKDFLLPFVDPKALFDMRLINSFGKYINETSSDVAVADANFVYTSMYQKVGDYNILPQKQNCKAFIFPYFVKNGKFALVVYHPATKKMSYFYGLDTKVDEQKEMITNFLNTSKNVVKKPFNRKDVEFEKASNFIVPIKESSMSAQVACMIMEFIALKMYVPKNLRRKLIGPNFLKAHRLHLFLKLFPHLKNIPKSKLL